MDDPLVNVIRRLEEALENSEQECIALRKMLEDTTTSMKQELEQLQSDGGNTVHDTCLPGVVG